MDDASFFKNSINNKNDSNNNNESKYNNDHKTRHRSSNNILLLTVMPKTRPSI